MTQTRVTKKKHKNSLQQFNCEDLKQSLRNSETQKLRTRSVQCVPLGTAIVDQGST